MRFKGAYYLVQTLADGYWRSDNLVDWTFVRPSRWPFTSVVAPALLADGDRLVIWPAMDKPGAILASDDPASGRLDFLQRMTAELPDAVWPGVEIGPGHIPPGPWDPGLFQDDDGRRYLYWGSSNVYPLYGIALDAGYNYVGHPTPLLSLDPSRHGWERFGPDNSGAMPDGTPVKPFVEGAWMTKLAGRYYLQYAAPGTEYNAYATGTYVGDKPLGPFHYPGWNPVAAKTGGFMLGAGHGSTVADAHGNLWLSATGWVGANWAFERRIVLFPARVWPDGQMSASTRFGDWPHYVPETRVDDPETLFTGWMLLSYHRAASASSTLPGFPAGNAADENPRTFWVAARNQPGETLTLDLGGPRTVRAVQVNFADYRSARFADAPDIFTAFRLEGSADGAAWTTLAEVGADHCDRPNAYIELPRPARLRFVRYVHGHVGAATLAIADLRVWGSAEGPAPPAPPHVTAVRQPDARDAAIRWTPVPGATGYNIRWGVRRDRLTQTDQLWAPAAQRTLRSLNVGQDYWVAVEAFNESGISAITRPIHLR